MVTFELVALIAAHEGLLTKINAAGGPGKLVIKDAGGATLVALPFVGGAVAPTTGQLTFTWGTRQDGLANGTAATAEVQDAANAKFMTLTCVLSGSPVADSCAMTTLQVVLGQPVEGVSFTIG